MLAAEMRKGLSRAVFVLVFLMIALNIALILFEPKPPEAGVPAQPSSDVFEGYDTAVLADAVIARDRLSGDGATHVRELYASLQKSVDDKEIHHDGLDPYLGENSAYLHGILYGRVMVVAWVEVGVLGMLVAMTIVGYDRAVGVQPVIWSSTVGRAVWGWKLLASTVLALAVAVVVIGVTMTVFIGRFGCGGWSDQVSSGWNRSLADPAWPFITWDRMTGLDYLGASLGIGMGLVVCFALLGAGLASLLRHAVAGFIVAVIIVLAMVVAPVALTAGHVSYSLAMMTPLSLALSAGRWFTDGGGVAIWPHYETLGLIGTASVVTLLISAAFIAVRKEDLI
ncbi:MAG: hypothetical protein LBV06_02515 [Propionibacteriaceae bacterium]|jgi:hypothetical protein|nr:hypothetical protein [Propionibacteriaceae bacterium]